MTDSSPLVSVILPFYNDAENLKRAIESVKHQTYSPIELILIDDASTDNSFSIAKSVVAKNLNVIFIQTTNVGCGGARNLGLKKASGKYVTFLDSDDELDDAMLATSVKIIETHPNVDIVATKFDIYLNNKVHLTDKGWIAKKANISPSETIKKMYKGGALTYTPWAKLFRLKLIKDTQFPEKIWFEDRSFFLEAVLNSKSTHLVDCVLLRNHIRKNSITRNIIVARRIHDLQLIFEREIVILKQHDALHQYGNYILSHHLNVLIENILILKVDYLQVVDLKEIRMGFVDIIDKLKKIIHSTDLKLTKKQTLLFCLLRFYKYAPKYWFEILVANILFRKRYIRVKQLKNPF